MTKPKSYSVHNKLLFGLDRILNKAWTPLFHSCSVLYVTVLKIRENHEFQLCFSVGKQRGKTDVGEERQILPPLLGKVIGWENIQCNFPHCICFTGKKVIAVRGEKSEIKIYPRHLWELDSSQEGHQNLKDSLLNWAVSVKLSSLRWKVFHISTKIGKYGLCTSAQAFLRFRATTQGHNRELSTFCPLKGWWHELLESRNKKFPPNHQKNVLE